MTTVEPVTTSQVAASAVLLGSVLALWTRFEWWVAATAAAVLSGYLSGTMHGPAGLWLLALAVCASRLPRSVGWQRYGWIGGIVILSLLLGLHALPGFSNPLVIHDAVLATGAMPYSQYVNFDKALGGTLLLGCGGWVAIRRPRDWTSALRRVAPVTSATVVVVLAASLALRFVAVEARWTPLFWTWAVLNLLTTCVSEEAFFRGLVQAELRRALPSRHAAGLAIGISALLFGAAHVAGGWRYVVLAAMAGCGYGLAYERTARLEMSILTHFTLNAVHFLLFTYPALW